MLKQISPQNIRALAIQDGSDNTIEFNCKSAKAIELFLNVTAVGASGDYDFFIDTSLGNLNDGEPVWFQQATVNIAAAQTVNMLINRIDHALGERFRIRWVKTTTTVTFSLKAAILE
jgi:hypothetical protein